MFNASRKDIHADLLFASMQSLRTEEALAQFAPEHFDYIVVDELHHASAPSYRAPLKAHGEFFLDAVETTRLTKSFKAYLYQAFVELSGVQSAVNVEALALRSRELLEHRPDRLVVELPVSVRRVEGDSRAWISYWCKNPIHYSCQQDKRSPQAWFAEEGNVFKLNFTVEESLQKSFEAYFIELIELRLAEYFARSSVAEKMVAEPGVSSENSQK